MSLFSLIRKAGDFFLPQTCVFCGSSGVDNGHFPVCEACLEEFIPIEPPFCTCCGEPFPGGRNEHLCGRCLKDPPPFLSARSLFAFKGRARDLIIGLKFQKNLSTLSIFDLILKRLLGWQPLYRDVDVVVAVPLNKKGLRRRGYNHALLMAESLAKCLAKPVDRTHLIKAKETPPQVGLTRAQRKRNLQGAFSVKRTNCLQGKAVLLVDDVFTTGATVRACTRALLNAGARSVRVLTFARTTLE